MTLVRGFMRGGRSVRSHVRLTARTSKRNDDVTIFRRGGGKPRQTLAVRWQQPNPAGLPHVFSTKTGRAYQYASGYSIDRAMRLASRIRRGV